MQRDRRRTLAHVEPRSHVGDGELWPKRSPEMSYRTRKRKRAIRAAQKRKGTGLAPRLPTRRSGEVTLDPSQAHARQHIGMHGGASDPGTACPPRVPDSARESSADSRG